MTVHLCDIDGGNACIAFKPSNYCEIDGSRDICVASRAGRVAFFQVDQKLFRFSEPFV